MDYRRIEGRQNAIGATAGATHRRFSHNAAPRWLRLALYVVLLALAGSGTVWLLVHYTIGAGTEAGLPHASEPWLMRLHGLACFAALFVFGAFSSGHAPRGLRMKRNLASATGLALLGATSICTGYVLYYFASETTRPAIGWLHSAASLLLCGVILMHRRPRGRLHPLAPAEAQRSHLHQPEAMS